MNVNRTGIDTKSLFGVQMKFDLRYGFPLVTTKKVFTKAIIHELLWFLTGDTNIKYLTDNGVHIWDAWADENGDLGPVYGKQWRDFDGVDQISNLVHDLKHNPDSRRMIVSAWSPKDIPNMQLPPCHSFFQCRVINGHLDLMLTQRSADMFLGIPFNIASYGFLMHMLAKVSDLKVGTFTHSIGDAHIYENHFDQVDTQLDRMPKTPPGLKLPVRESIFDYVYDDFEIVGYDPHPTIKGVVAV